MIPKGWIKEGGRIDCLRPYVLWMPGAGLVELDGEFSVEELIDIVRYTILWTEEHDALQRINILESLKKTEV